MSMLPKQCKELRAEAERIGYWSPTASRLMFDAADILWSLRNKNVALLGENESLQAENARLRELVKDMYAAFVHGNCYRWCEFKEPCNYIIDGKCQWYDRMRELGVEVDA